ncbi:hypothetical protein D3C85_1531250 [compost metagenome]
MLGLAVGLDLVPEKRLQALLGHGVLRDRLELADRIDVVFFFQAQRLDHRPETEGPLDIDRRRIDPDRGGRPVEPTSQRQIAVVRLFVAPLADVQLVDECLDETL